MCKLEETKKMKKMLSTNEYVLNHEGTLVTELLSYSVSTTWNEAIREWVAIGINVHRTLIEKDDTVIYEHGGLTEVLTRHFIPGHKSGKVFETYVDVDGNSREFEVVYKGLLEHNYIDSEGRVVKKIMRCTCGKHIERITTLLNVNTSHVMVVGSTCATKFVGNNHMEELTNENTLVNVARVNTELINNFRNTGNIENSQTEHISQNSVTNDDVEIVAQTGIMVQQVQQQTPSINCHVLRYNTARSYIGDPGRWRIFYVRRAQQDFTNPLLLDPFLECSGKPVIGYFLNEYDDIIIVPLKACQVFFGIQLKVLLDIKRDFDNGVNGKIMKLLSLEVVRRAGIINQQTYVFYRSVALISEQRVQEHIMHYDDANIRPVNFLSYSQKNSIFNINRQILCHLNNINNLVEF